MDDSDFQSVVSLGPITALSKKDEKLIFDVLTRQFIKATNQKPELTSHDKFVNRFLIGLVIGIGTLIFIVFFTICRNSTNQMS